MPIYQLLDLDHRIHGVLSHAHGSPFISSLSLVGGREQSATNRFLLPPSEGNTPRMPRLDLDVAPMVSNKLLRLER
jgi:hypothetical protein